MKLLLVEDHLLVAQAMGLYLTEAGHEIVGIAADAHEAVELAGGMHPDLALVDIQLAYGTSGVEGAPSNIIVRVSARDSVHKGDTIHVTTDPKSVHVFDAESGDRLSD